MTTPSPGSTLTGTSVAFSWTPGNVAKNFELWVGTTGPGSTNLYNSGSVTATTETVSNLPANGQPVYARLYYYINGSWQYVSYTYTAYGAPTPATLTTPTPGSTLTGTSVTFSWTPGNVAKNFELWLGTTNGSSNLYNSGSVTATTETVSGLPSNGQPVYVRLYSLHQWSLAICQLHLHDYGSANHCCVDYTRTEQHINRYQRRLLVDSRQRGQKLRAMAGHHKWREQPL